MLLARANNLHRRRKNYWHRTKNVKLKGKKKVTAGIHDAVIRCLSCDITKQMDGKGWA